MDAAGAAVEVGVGEAVGLQVGDQLAAALAQHGLRVLLIDLDTCVRCDEYVRGSVRGRQVK